MRKITRNYRKCQRIVLFLSVITYVVGGLSIWHAIWYFAIHKFRPVFVSFAHDSYKAIIIFALAWLQRIYICVGQCFGKSETLHGNLSLACHWRIIFGIFARIVCYISISHGARPRGTIAFYFASFGVVVVVAAVFSRLPRPLIMPLCHMPFLRFNRAEWSNCFIIFTTLHWHLSGVFPPNRRQFSIGFVLITQSSIAITFISFACQIAMKAIRMFGSNKRNYLLVWWFRLLLRCHSPFCQGWPEKRTIQYHSPAVVTVTKDLYMCKSETFAASRWPRLKCAEFGEVLSIRLLSAMQMKLLWWNFLSVWWFVSLVQWGAKIETFFRVDWMARAYVEVSHKLSVCQ